MSYPFPEDRIPEAHRVCCTGCQWCRHEDLMREAMEEQIRQNYLGKALRAREKQLRPVAKVAKEQVAQVKELSGLVKSLAHAVKDFLGSGGALVAPSRQPLLRPLGNQDEEEDKTEGWPEARRYAVLKELSDKAHDALQEASLRRSEEGSLGLGEAGDWALGKLSLELERIDSQLKLAVNSLFRRCGHEPGNPQCRLLCDQYPNHQACTGGF
jgi:hypothetical protein